MYFHLHDLPYFRDHLAEYLGPPRTVLPQNTINRDPAHGCPVGDDCTPCLSEPVSSNPSNVE